MLDNKYYVKWECPICGDKHISATWFCDESMEYCDCCNNFFEIHYEIGEIWHVIDPSIDPIKKYKNIEFCFLDICCRKID